jgi:hypothetical protein
MCLGLGFLYSDHLIHLDLLDRPHSPSRSATSSPAGLLSRFTSAGAGSFIAFSSLGPQQIQCFTRFHHIPKTRLDAQAAGMNRGTSLSASFRQKDRLRCVRVCICGPVAAARQLKDV